MSRINILDEHLTNMIAAGEVVERPMGVVKELVENSIDAQATKIEIRITNGGLDSIEIIDDGCGMDSKDATRAFNRHATSKISEINDLWQIKTMGFRGEALPSIASVSKVTLLTNDGNDSTQVVIEYGKLIEAKPAAFSQGTSVKVEGLFYKTPARLKHMKSANTEANMIFELIQKIALSHPEIAFELYSDDRLRIETNGSNDLQETILAIYGLDIAKRCIKLDFSDFDFKVTGFVVAPSITRTNRNYINLFINNRVVKSLYLQKAVIEACHSFMMPDKYPIAVINIETDFQLVDVNVHPSKWEVRISKEKQLYALMLKNIEEAIKEYSKPSDLLIDHVITREDTPKIERQKFEEEKLDLSSYIVKETVIEYTEPKKEIIEEVFEYTEKPLEQNEEKVLKEEVKQYVADKAHINRFQYLAQLHGKYILACDEDNLYIVDQHAAQERCMYEDIQAQIMNNSVDTQPLLVPIVIEFTASIINQLDHINEILSCINLTLEQFSSNSVVVHEIPLFMEDANETELIINLVNEIVNDNDMNMLEIRKDKIATLACHSSVRFNHFLTPEESIELLKRLSNCLQPFNCPHGRPTMISINDKQLEKEFKRV